ncbi:MAG TPA: MBOAT family O-acyltransferase [Candidatus Sulfopaludibacter sp.]|nr:MBOAT family O-acyltransferase [Candidatus Sulfopaludibacter sp.]
MDSASLQFILFGLAAAILSNLSRSSRWRTAVLLGASLAFVAAVAPGWTEMLPLAGFLAAGYFGIAAVRRRPNQTVSWICLVIAAYVWLKKYTFLPHSLFLPGTYFVLGLSYIFFRVLHLIIESGDQAGQPESGPGKYLTYTLNFTTFVSGPIQRYSAFAEDQFAGAPAKLDTGVVAAQIERMIRGYFKVNVAALLLSIVRSDALAKVIHPGPPATKALPAIELMALYPFFLYANFSGYIDIVIALARLMRVRLPENFDRPFAAASFMDFWSRWHITLSTWLKTYVYNPLLLSLSRRFPAPALQAPFAVTSLFVTFFLVGIWHGRTSEFALFGVLQGGGVALNLIWQLALIRQLGRKRYRNVANGTVYEAVGRGLSFTWFAFTLCWFWGDWGQLRAIYGGMEASWWLAVWGGMWLAMTFVLAAWEWLRGRLLRVQWGGVAVLHGPYARAVWTTAMVFVWFVIGLVIGQPAPEIVYKAF